MPIKAQPAMPRALADQLIHEAIEILAATDDGDRLSPFHLKLVEHAVNARLNAAGRVCFAALLANVRTGYTPTPYKFVRSDTALASTLYRARDGTLHVLMCDGEASCIGFYATDSDGHPVGDLRAFHSSEFDPFLSS